MEKITFKYHPNVWEQDVFSKRQDGSMAVCQCCGNETEYFYESMYTAEDVDCICPECIASGKAAEKFKGDFVQYAETDEVDDPQKIDELFKRTPGYMSWQGEYWLACCNDFCAYIGDVGTKQLEEMGIVDEVFEEYENRDDSFEDIRESVEKCGSIAGYLFKCLHCGKHHLWVDAD